MFTWEDACKHADKVIERVCAEQGITVRLADHAAVLSSANILRIGKKNADSIRVESL